MKYNIRECKLYGIKNPFIFLNGWVESAAKEIVIKAKNRILYKHSFLGTKSKAHSFDIRIGLENSKLIDDVIISFVDNQGNEIVVRSFKTTPLSRLKEKLITPKKYKFSNNLLGVQKQIYHDTLSMHKLKDYHYWIKNHEKFSDVVEYDYNPLISIVMPVYNVPAKYLQACLDSILQQTYQKFEVCIADDCSTNAETVQTLQKYVEKDSRIKVLFREKNGHISEATNSALTLASGEFIGLMDNDDLLMPQALNEIVSALNKQRDLDFIYTDEDKVDLDGVRSDPQFKPDFALDKLYGGNYICHFSVIRKPIIEEVGGFRKGYEGAQDFDLFIRIAEVTKKFYHIPKILYHWRMIPGSTALDAGSKNYAGEAGKRALEDLFSKKGINTQISIVVHTHYFVEYLFNDDPTVDVLIHIEQTGKKISDFIYQFYANQSYRNLRFILFNDTNERLSFGEQIKELDIVTIDVKESYSAELKAFLTTSKNENVLFLNEGAVIDTFDAIDIMIGYNNQFEIGAVGCKVLNKYNFVVDSGYYLLDEKLLPLYHATYENDYGIYGTLLVPNNFQVIEDTFFMIHKRKLDLSRCLNDNLNKREMYLQIMLYLNANEKRNIVIPRVEAFRQVESTKYSKLSQKAIDSWRKAQYLTDFDKYYNENMSTRMSFRLEK